ncbi:MAG TPA: acyl-CoA dehydrogenase family protein [Candidatus Cybelea sp.]|jgi:putative acyl-CoA dehydrogenase
MLDNQPPALENYNLFRTDRVLREAVAREAPDGVNGELTVLGELAGRAETIALGFDANEHPPELRTHDRFGERIDEVRFHPAWHTLMSHALRAGLAGLAWDDPRPNPHVRRAAKFFLWSQVEAGHGCPLSMTYAAVPVVRALQHAGATWVRALTQPHYDARTLPIEQKSGGLCGMGMTERQGGSDIRTNQTRAIAATTPGSGQEYLLDGQKWFCSAPASDAFLVLAQAPSGISCFLVPRVLPDATRNAMQLVRLKDKLGNRSNASAEVEFHAAHGWLIGDEGEGLVRIVEMVNHTRLDCALGSAGLMRAALAQAIHHAIYRRAFGKALIDQPLMQNVLADLALESEAATLLVLRVARTIDAPNSPAASALKRIGTALAKYYICKRAPAIAAEALECLGGNGYVEESIMPRLYREAPLNSIWEGSGNVNALDVVRVLQKQPEAYAAWRAELEAALDEPLIAAELRGFERDLRDRSLAQAQARALGEKMALLWQAALLHRYAPSLVAEAFLRSRLGAAGRTLGTLPPAIDFRSIIDRAAPMEAP